MPTIWETTYRLFFKLIVPAIIRGAVASLLLRRSRDTREIRMRAHFSLCLMILVCGVAASAAEAQTPLQACYAKSLNRNTVEQCLKRQLQEADTAMAEALGLARREMGEVDLATGGSQGAKALAAGQREFLGFREANCAWYAARMSSGIGAGDAALDCTIRMTRARADELRAQVSAAESLAEPALPAESASVMAWQGVEWKLTKLVRDGKEVPLVAKSRITAAFHAAGRVAGMASVNRYFGSYKARGDGRIEWPAPAFGATRMAGPPALMKQEGLFLDALGKVSKARMEGSKFLLANEDGSVELTFER
jgi:heat shock protein HslJ